MTKDEALKLALDYIVATNKSSEFWLVPASNLNNVVTAIKEALAQPEQEPVAFISPGGHIHYDPYLDSVPLYTTPPQRTVQVSPLEFVEMVMDKEHLVGNPIVWAQWPNKEKNFD